jgi:hypothetical protein
MDEKMVSILMPKMSHLGKKHRHAMFVRSGDHFLIPH